ncbi:MAG TPA: hypothetical protein VGH81_07885 [Rudaea sp.]|jgi:hypothetical protein
MLPAANGIVQGQPDHVNAASSDYRSQATSIGVDFAPATGGVDLDGNPLGVDLAPGSPMRALDARVDLPAFGCRTGQVARSVQGAGAFDCRASA